jgi:hypothetical protein
MGNGAAGARDGSGALVGKHTAKASRLPAVAIHLRMVGEKLAALQRSTDSVCCAISFMIRDTLAVTSSQLYSFCVVVFLQANNDAVAIIAMTQPESF